MLTPDFEYVMGKRVCENQSTRWQYITRVVLSLYQNSEIFRRFEETAVKAYMIIRENANLFINLFSMVRD